jgi:signal transduction histidine kinase
MRQSINRQITAIFAGITVLLLVTLILANTGLLEPYYVMQKERAFISMYKSLSDAVKNGTYEDETTKTTLVNEAESGNITFLVYDAGTGKGVTNSFDIGSLKNQLSGYLLNQLQEDSEILQETDAYQITRTKDIRSERDYLEMWGSCETNVYFLLRSPLESLRESAALSNKFLLRLGLLEISFGIIAVWYFSRRLSAPILELVRLSKKMTDLDFEARYESGGENEIGILGENFNKMSEKLKASIAELKSANLKLAHDLERKEKDEQLQRELLGNVSHELKTPIALIQGYAEGLKEGVNADEESRNFYCDVIVDEAAKMNRMVQNLLALNQLEYGKNEPVFERFDIVSVISGVLKSMEILADQSGAKIIFRPAAPIFVWSDVQDVETVLRNYLSNAFHHLSGDRVIEVKTNIENERLRVSVFNTGEKIPEDDLQHIWDKFYKVDKAHTREYGGSGIGLSIVKATVSSLGQEYGVRNYENGVEFYFTLDVK